MKIRSLTKRKGGEKMNGLTLLLLFAFGAVQKNICGNNSFARRVKRYLLGDYSLKPDIKKEIPQQLKTAWPMLKKIAKEIKSRPLAEKTVSFYIFKMHNRLVPPVCKVKSGVIKKIDKKTRKLLVKSGKKSLVVNFFEPFGGNLKTGKKIFFHHGWLIGLNARYK